MPDDSIEIPTIGGGVLAIAVKRKEGRGYRILSENGVILVLCGAAEWHMISDLLGEILRHVSGVGDGAESERTQTSRHQ